MSKKRAGRPRKSGPRKPSGDLKAMPDYGTQELSMHRIAAVGDTAVTGRDIARDQRSSYPLGVLLLQGAINAKQHYAGRRYFRLYHLVCGGANVRSCLGSLVSGSSGRAPTEPEGASLDMELAEFRAAQASVIATGYGTLAIVDRVAVFNETPRDDNLDRLKIGLDHLYIHFHGDDPAFEAPYDIDMPERERRASASLQRVLADEEMTRRYDEQVATRKAREQADQEMADE